MDSPTLAPERPGLVPGRPTAPRPRARLDPTAEPESTRYGRVWWLFLAAGGLVVASYEFLPDGLPQDVAYLAVGLAGVAAILVGVRLHQPVRRRAWWWMAAGQLIWVAGDTVGSWVADAAHIDTFPSPADPLYLLAYPVLACGLLLLLRGRRLRGDRSGLLDSAICTIGLGILSWVLLAKPTMMNYRESPAAAVVAVAYPLGDILLLALLIRFLTTPGSWTASLRLLLGAVALLVAVDTTASALSLLAFDSTDAIDAGWLLSYLLWGAAALHPSMSTLSRPSPPQPIRFTRLRLVALTLAVLVAPGTLAVEYVVGVPLDVWAVVVGSVAMFSLVVARMNTSIGQIVAANRQRERLQDDLAHQAAHDSLTGLANRAQAMRLIRGALSRSQRSGSVVGLLFIDLDGFKRINDTLGHAAGDEVLREVARRMQDSVRAGDTVARLGGDEFLVLLETLDEQASAVVVADRLVAAVARPVLLTGGRPVRVGASVGVALSQDGIADPEVLLHEADVAVYRAKASGRGRTEVFDEYLRLELTERHELEAAISRAMERDELVVHYQPIVQVMTGEIAGYEALVRWNRPGVGMVPPDDFIPVAEHSDLICEVDAWVLRRAVQQLARWNALPDARPLTMSVNVSGRHVARSRIRSDVTTALVASGVAAHQLVLEITETALIDDPQALGNLEDLRELGVAISIDDFGTGYSSITRLETLPVDVVKVDKRFLDRGSASSDKLLRLIVQAAHAFGLPVVAEGVETEAQLKVLRSIDCEFAQGYFLGRPAEAGRLAGRRPVDPGGFSPVA